MALESTERVLQGAGIVFVWRYISYVICETQNLKSILIFYFTFLFIPKGRSCKKVFFLFSHSLLHNHTGWLGGLIKYTFQGLL